MTPTLRTTLAANLGATQHHDGEVPLGVTLLFAGILVAMILCLALEEKLHAKKSVIVGAFAMISLAKCTTQM